MTEFANPAAYELWMGRWSARLAPTFAAFADVSAKSRLLDVGSGTGALSLALLAAHPEAEIVGVEPSGAYVAHCRENCADPRLRFEAGDALALAFPDASFDAALSLLVLQEIPDAARAVREMFRVTRPGGVVAASQWDFAEGMPMLALFWDAVLDVAPSQAARETASACMEVDYPDAAALRGLWRNARLAKIETERQQVEMTFASFEDYWRPFAAGVSPASSFAATLAEAERSEIERRLRRKTLGAAPDGPFTLSAHAWAIRGIVPEA